MKRFVLSIAALALMLMPFSVQAQEIEQYLYENININVNENTNINVDKNLNVDINAKINIKGSEWLYGYGEYGWWWGKRGLTVDGLASAVINNTQILKFNTVINEENPNTATVTDNVGQDATGKIGINVVAGDNNAQDNVGAIAFSEQTKSMADAEIFKTQLSLENFTCNKGRTNSATMDGNALQYAIGDIGVNIAAGNNNAQSNMLAIAIAPAKVGIANVNIKQESAGNTTINKPVKVEEVQWVRVDLGLSARLTGTYAGGYIGVAGGNYSGSESGKYSGSYSGISDQVGDLYVDNWQGPSHPGGPHHGHSDFDRYAQGAVDRNNDGGAFSFNESGRESGTYSGSASGTYSGIELGVEGGSLGGSITGKVTGNIPVVIKRNVNMVNTASLSGNALQGATGNIGVNIAAGTGNLQANALAVSYLPNRGGSIPTPGVE